MPQTCLFVGKGRTTESPQMVLLLTKRQLSIAFYSNDLGIDKMFGWKSENRVCQIAEMSGAWTAATQRIATGLVAGTRFATPNGWRAVEAIAAGDQVLTFDGGFQTVVAVNHGAVWSSISECPAEAQPMNLPAGALGNREAMQLLPEQTIMLESDVAEEAFGDPFVLVPARALEGFRGIERAYQRGEGHLVSLQFAEDQIVFANIGALFFCPGAGDLVSTPLTQYDYTSLNMEQADTLIACIEMVDLETDCPATHHVAPQYVAA